ncbi:MAG: Na+/H+ antiporter subunit D [Marinilabiliales bacterium]|nr:MAG: Na+/H+ antiporter subunit D [Marinilabiliales bacterium]
MIITALPILIPFILIIVLILVRSNHVSKWVSVTGSLILLIASIFILHGIKDNGILLIHMGGWKAPFGITLVIDYLSGIMLITSSLIVFTISIYSLSFLEEKQQNSKFYVFFFSLVMGINGSFITGDVFNLYVWFEVMLMSSLVLITLGNSKQQLEGGIKYLALNLLGSLFFLAGLGLLYGKTGTLNMAYLAEILKNDDQAILMNTSAILFFIAFGIKAAVFPLFFWLPASYHTSNITVSALFAGLLTKVGLYAFIRFFTLFFVQDQVFWHKLLLVIAGFTMVVGGMSASIHYDTRRILSYHIISQIGYMIMGLGIFTPLAIAGAIFFTIHNMVAKTNTFLVAGLIHKLKGSFYLKDIGGLLKQSPFLAILFIIPAFALAGVPPLSGFFAKFMLIKAGIDEGHYIVVFVSVLTGLLTLYSMVKIWNEAFLKKQPTNEYDLEKLQKLSFMEVLPSVILGMASIFMGVFAVHVFDLTMDAANQLLNSSTYIEQVLNY